MKNKIDQNIILYRLYVKADKEGDTKKIIDRLLSPHA